MKSLIQFLVTVAVLGVVGVLGISFLMERGSTKYIFTNLENVELKDTAVVTGTMGYVDRTEEAEQYRKERLKAAARAFQAGKVTRVRIMGDSVSAAKDGEPEGMKQSLIGRGVPVEAIETETGVRSAYEAVKTLEGTSDGVLFVSQTFHAKRLVYMARELEVDAVGYGVSVKERSVMEQIREQGARARNARGLYWYKWIEKPNYFQYSQE